MGLLYGIGDNDLVGEGYPWGRKSNLCEWKLSVYSRFQRMYARCYSPKAYGYSTYGGAGIRVDSSLRKLSQYVEVLRNDPLWDLFCSNPSAYDIDKDTKLGHGVDYSKDSIRIISKSANVIESNSRRPQNYRTADAVPIKIVKPDGTVIVAEDYREASNILGVSYDSLRGKVNKKPGVYERGPLKGWHVYKL